MANGWWGTPETNPYWAENEAMKKFWSDLASGVGGTAKGIGRWGTRAYQPQAVPVSPSATQPMRPAPRQKLYYEDGTEVPEDLMRTGRFSANDSLSAPAAPAMVPQAPDAGESDLPAMPAPKLADFWRQPQQAAQDMADTEGPEYQGPSAQFTGAKPTAPMVLGKVRDASGRTVFLQTGLKPTDRISASEWAQKYGDPEQVQVAAFPGRAAAPGQAKPAGFSPEYVGQTPEESAARSEAAHAGGLMAGPGGQIITKRSDKKYVQQLPMAEWAKTRQFFGGLPPRMDGTKMDPNEAAKVHFAAQKEYGSEWTPEKTAQLLNTSYAQMQEGMLTRKVAATKQRGAELANEQTELENKSWPLKEEATRTDIAARKQAMVVQQAQLELSELKARNATRDEVVEWAKGVAQQPGVPKSLGLRLVLAAKAGSGNELDGLTQAIDQAAEQAAKGVQAGKVALKGSPTATKEGKPPNYTSQAAAIQKMIAAEGDPQTLALLNALYRSYILKMGMAGVVPGPETVATADEDPWNNLDEGG